MKITNKKITPTTEFRFLDIGDVFLYKGIFYMKTTLIQYNSSSSNAVGVGNTGGEFYYVHPDELVVLCNAELIIT